MQYNKQEKKFNQVCSAGLIVSLHNRMAERKGQQIARDRAITYRLCHDAHLTLTFSGL